MRDDDREAPPNTAAMQLLTTIEVKETPLIPPKPPTFLPTKKQSNKDILKRDELHQCLNNVITF